MRGRAAASVSINSSRAHLPSNAPIGGGTLVTVLKSKPTRHLSGISARPKMRGVAGKTIEHFVVFCPTPDTSVSNVKAKCVDQSTFQASVAIATSMTETAFRGARRPATSSMPKVKPRKTAASQTRRAAARFLEHSMRRHQECAAENSGRHTKTPCWWPLIESCPMVNFTLMASDVHFE